MANIGLNSTEIKKAVSQSRDEITALVNALNKVDEDLATLQKGDGEVAYWSGENAYTWVYNTLTCVNKLKLLADHISDAVYLLESAEILNSLTNKK